MSTATTCDWCRHRIGRHDAQSIHIPHIYPDVSDGLDLCSSCRRDLPAAFAAVRPPWLVRHEAVCAEEEAKERARLLEAHEVAAVVSEATK